jgi:glutamate carboxypeptidase
MSTRLVLALTLAACGAPSAPAAPVATPSPAPTPAASPGLDATERAIAAAVDADQATALEELELLVNINSGTMNFAGVLHVGNALRMDLQRLGFTCTWIDGAPFGRAGHLVADHPGPGPRVLLIGHLDTVFERDSPFQRFERIDERTARGPGIIDMKGGDVIIVSALRALEAAGVLARMNLVVVMTGDEEHPGAPLATARRALVEAATGAVAAIGFEDGDGDPGTANTARRGATAWTLRVTGTPAHSSQIFQPEVGAGAIFEAARILDGFRIQLASERLLTYNPGLALGGTRVELRADDNQGFAAGKTNVVARDMVVQGDLRPLSLDQLARAKATMRAVVAQPLPHTRAELAFDDGYPPMAPTDGNARLLARYDGASRDLGAGPVRAVDPRKAGAADVSFVAARVAMALDGVGLAGRDDHTERETADLGMLAPLTKRAAVLLYRLTARTSSR